MGSLLQDPRYGLRSRAGIVRLAAREGVPSDHRSTHSTKRGGISFHTIIARSTRSSRRSSRAPARASSKVAYRADVNDESIVPCRMIPFSLYMRRLQPSVTRFVESRGSRPDLDCCCQTGTRTPLMRALDASLRGQARRAGKEAHEEAKACAVVPTISGRPWAPSVAHHSLDQRHLLRACRR
jgi:hypothetical protein